MDVLWFLRQRLRFTSNLYDVASAPFRETTRKIEAGEEPFVNRRNPDYDDSEPPFLQEFLEASEAVDVMGHWCLMMTFASLQAFLREHVSQMAGAHGHDAKEVRARCDAVKARNWFERYRKFYLEEFGIDWNKGPVKLDDLEQINLTRDDLVHNVEVTSPYVYRTEKHAARFPKSLFTDELWEGLAIGSKIKVGRDELTRALQIVESFCAWLEENRGSYRRFKNGGSAEAAKG